MKLRAIVVVAALAACGGGSNNSEDGSLNGKCYPNSTCNAGLMCSGGVCHAGLDVDAAVPHHDAAPIDTASVDALSVDAQALDAQAIDAQPLPDAPIVIDAGVIDGTVVLIDGSFPDAGSTTCNVLTQTGCGAGEKCTWILDTDATASDPGLGHIGCAPSGTVAGGAACTVLPAAQGGYDNCIKADACVTGICKTICDNNGGTPACGSSQACVTYDGLFANSGATTIPAGVCDPSCNPITDNDFDGSGTMFTKTGSGCGSNPVTGCYGLPSYTNTTYFTCAPPAGGTGTLTHRSILPPGAEFINSCMSGYTIAFGQDAAGSNNIDCYAFCAPGEAYLGNTGTQLPNGVAPHRCNNTDALGAFGATPNGTAASNGEHCVYSWIFEEDTVSGTVHTSPTSNTVGICWDHSKYQYDANGDGVADTTIPPCASLPLVPATGALGAADVSCVTTTTAGLSFTGKPLTVHRPYIESFPELRPTSKRR